MIYLDASALVKLVRAEAGSAELVSWLSAREDRDVVSSVLSEVEVGRALRRESPAALENLASVMAGVARVEIGPEVRALAVGFEDPLFRSFDAIHLATALVLATAEAAFSFVAYDRRLLSIAKGRGFDVASPGLEA